MTSFHIKLVIGSSPTIPGNETGMRTTGAEGNQRENPIRKQYKEIDDQRINDIESIDKEI